MSERPKARGNHSALCLLPSHFHLLRRTVTTEFSSSVMSKLIVRATSSKAVGQERSRSRNVPRPSTPGSMTRLRTPHCFCVEEQNAVDLFVFDVQGDGFGRLRRRDRAEDQDCEERRAAESHVRENTPPYGRHSLVSPMFCEDRRRSKNHFSFCLLPLPSDVRPARRSWRSPARLRCRPWRGRIASAAAAVRRGLSAAGVCPRRPAGVLGQWPRRLHSASPDQPPTPSRRPGSGRRRPR